MKKAKARDNQLSVASTDGVDERLRSQLEAELPRVLSKFRWFGGKSRTIKAVAITETIPFRAAKENFFFTLFSVEYRDGRSETYQLPLGLAFGKTAAEIRKKSPKAIVFNYSGDSKASNGVVYDATFNTHFRSELFKSIVGLKRLKGRAGELVPSITESYGMTSAKLARKTFSSKLLNLEQSNTSINYGNRFVLKLIRRQEEGVNPDVEIGRFITDHTDFMNAPQSVGALEYSRLEHEPMTLGSLQAYVPNKGDAWSVFMKGLELYCRKLLKQGSKLLPPAIPKETALELAEKEIPKGVVKELKPFLQMAELLGRRTIEMHLALASETEDPRFKAEVFTLSYQQDLYQAIRQQLESTIGILRRMIETLPKPLQAPARKLIEAEKHIKTGFAPLLSHEARALKTRTHGDYHLGQVLYTGKDFVIIDFEGEPARTIQERRIKRSPLRDVAGMLRSFHYASYVAAGSLSAQQASRLLPWLSHWHAWVCAAFLKGYFSGRGKAYFLPDSRQTIKMLLDIHLMEKALYELIYEINNRPDWVKVPLSGILDLLEAQP
jgi:maltose alpha-D-glucosyltransferase/alpha-amylase